MLGTKAHIQRINKFFGKACINSLLGKHYKFNAVTGSQVKYFGISN